MGTSYSQQGSVESQGGLPASWSNQDPVCAFPYLISWQIMDYVPTRHLIKAGLLVSKTWYEYLREPDFWMNRMSRCGNYSTKLESIASHIEWPKLCLYCTDQSNWIKSFDSNKKLCLHPFWKTSSTPWNKFKVGGQQMRWDMGGGDHWKVEEWIKEDSEEDKEVLEENEGVCQNYVTSYDWCCRHQIIELASVGLCDKIMDEIRPPISVSEWFCARWDCGSVFHIRIELLGENGRDVIDAFETFMKTEQWQGGDLGWRKISHTFSVYSKGARFLRFADAGKDTQFWAGPFGSKMAAAKAQVLFKSLS